MDTVQRERGPAVGLFARLLGTRGPDDGTAPVPADELRRRLLAMHHPRAPWVIRPGAPERVDVVAEWNARVGPDRYHFMILIALDEDRRQARTLDKLWQSGPSGAQYGQGGGWKRAAGGTIGRDEHGRRRFVREQSFDTRLLKDPIRATVTEAGWTWKGLIRHP